MGTSRQWLCGGPLTLSHGYWELGVNPHYLEENLPPAHPLSKLTLGMLGTQTQIMLSLVLQFKL